MGHPHWRRPLLAVLTLCAAVLLSQAIFSSVRWIHKPFPGFFLHENLTVGPYFLPQWSGRLAGLKSLDLVVAVNDRPLQRRGDLYRLAKRSPPGTPLHYRVVRDSRTLELDIPSMDLSLLDWFLTFGVYITVALAFLIIGVAPYYARASSPAAWPLCLMVFAVFVWFVTTFDFMTGGILPKELRLFGLAVTPSAGIHLAMLLKTGRPLRRSFPALFLVLYGLSLLLGWLNSVTFFGPTENWIHVFQAGYGYTCAGAVIFLMIIGKALRGSVLGLERSRLRVIFVGGLLGFFLPTLSTVFTSSFHWPIPYNLALLPTVFFPLSVAYALLKYSLFDLGNALKVALSRVALTGILLAIYAAVVLLAGPALGIDRTQPVIPLFFSVMVVLTFNPLLRWIERAVDRYVYRLEYDPAGVQQEVSWFLRSLATPSILTEGFIRRVTERMGIEAAMLVYRARGSNDFIETATEGMANTVLGLGKAMTVLLGPPLATHWHGLTRDEVMTHPSLGDYRQSMLAIFERLSAELLIPIVFEGDVRGWVCFGAKNSKREFSSEDLRLLGTLTDQLALSLENGRLYQESVEARHRAEAATRVLVESDRIKKQFVANICHELRTPVSTIIGYSEILLGANVSHEAQTIVQRLVHNGQELSQVMDNLLNFSIIESGLVNPKYEIVKLSEIFSGLEIMTQRLIGKRPIEFAVTAEPLIDSIQTDGQKVQQIMVHLLTNASKFTEKGKIRLIVRAVDEAGREFVEISVSDTGMGIKKEDQEIIFDDFRQLDGSSTRHFGGTGLGLGLCKKLAEALGGTIRVTSEPGRGSRFSLLLPIRDASLSGGIHGAGSMAEAVH